MLLQLSLNDFHNDWAKLVGKAIGHYELLTPDERIWYNIQALIDAVDYGGFINYFTNSSNRLPDTVADLTAIGAVKIVELLKQVNSFIPEKILVSDIGGHSSSLANREQEVFENQLDSFDARFYAEESLLENVLIEHILAKNLFAVC